MLSSENNLYLLHYYLVVKLPPTYCKFLCRSKVRICEAFWYNFLGRVSIHVLYSLGHHQV